MTDTVIGFALLATGIVVVLGVVFAISSRGGGASGRPKPPRGVHLPPPSLLPVVLSLAAALIGAGFAVRSSEQLANPFLAIPGLIVFVGAAVTWVLRANHEWRDTEHGSHDDGTAH